MRRALVSLAALAITLPLGCVTGKPADQATSLSAQDDAPPPPEPLPPVAAAPSTRPVAMRTQALQASPVTPVAPAPSAAQPFSANGPLPNAPLDPTLLAQMGGAGLALLTPGGVAGDVIEGGIKQAAVRLAPNMQPEGQMARDTLAEGAHKEMLVTLTGSKCYTIIGFSPAGQVRDLDLHLLAPPFYNVQAGQDDTSDGTPAIGKGGNPTCPLTPLPLQYKVDIHAKRGGGTFGVQVFSRSK